MDSLRRGRADSLVNLEGFSRVHVHVVESLTPAYAMCLQGTYTATDVPVCTFDSIVAWAKKDKIKMHGF